MNRLRGYLFVAVAIVGGTTSAMPSQAARPTKAVQKALQNEPLLLGTAWYPEQWPESRWNIDLQLMEDAHIHVVRLAEFSWSTMEPEEGHYEFGWLDRAIELAASHHIFVVLGTPTAAPPAWLTQRYPETLRVDENGVRAEHGNRQQFSFTSPVYRKFTAAIAEEMARRYGHNPNVIGWQIDNELATPSFDASACKAFHHWLQMKYGNIGKLNQEWATAYWSETYDNFDEIPVHSKDENPALLLDWKRFVTDAWIGYLNVQITAMRPYLGNSQWITTNTMHWFQGFDEYKLNRVLDLASWDDYVPNGHLDPILNAVEHDLVRGYKQQNFWVMETQPAFVDWGKVNAALPRGVTREMAWQAIGHGANAVLYWQWRPAPNGQEEYHGSLLGADGEPTPVYSEIQQLGAEMDAANDTLHDTNVHADVAVLQDYDSHWAIDFQRHTEWFHYEQQITDLYRALKPSGNSGISTIDLVSTMADLSRYRIVFAPSLNVLPTATAAHLLAYVRDGGLLVFGPRSGMKNEDDGLQPNGQPGPLKDALGMRVRAFYALDAPVSVHGEGISDGKALVWAEDLQPLSADDQILLTYGSENGWLKGRPAAVERKVGRGAIVYVGAMLDVTTLRALLLPMLHNRGVVSLVRNLPKDVEVMQRDNGLRVVWIVENHGNKSQQIELGRIGRDVLEKDSVETSGIDLPAHGVAVMAMENH